MGTAGRTGAFVVGLAAAFAAALGIGAAVGPLDAGSPPAGSSDSDSDSDHRDTGSESAGTGGPERRHTHDD